MQQQHHTLEQTGCQPGAWYGEGKGLSALPAPAACGIPPALPSTGGCSPSPCALDLGYALALPSGTSSED